MHRFPSLVLASALLLATASGAGAQTERREGPIHPDRAAMHKHMCDAFYAHKAGHVATVEAMLDLTAQQKPAFDKWSQAVLGNAQARRKECQTMTPPDPRNMTALDREAHAEKRLAEAEKALKTIRPSLEALYNSLNAEQKKTFDHMSMMRGPGHGHGKMGGFMHRPEGMGMMHPPGQPPAPPQTELSKIRSPF